MRYFIFLLACYMLAFALREIEDLKLRVAILESKLTMHP